MSSFNEKFRRLRKKKRSILCVGLDPDPERIPKDTPGKNFLSKSEYFLRTVIEAVATEAIAWKPNLAFFESMGPQGLSLLEDLITYLRQHSPASLVILDAKRSDIGNTARHYARAVFEKLDADAVTLSPYMGMDTLKPFLEYPQKAAIVLCHTSNSGADWLQLYGSPPLYLHLAQSLARHPKSNQIWLVVGATKATASIREIRKAAPRLPFLIPGIGAQGGNLSEVCQASGKEALINVGRSILYAATSIEDLPQAAHRAAQTFTEEIRRNLPELGEGHAEDA